MNNRIIKVVKEDTWEETVLGQLCVGLFQTTIFPWIVLAGIILWDFELMTLDYD